MWTKFTDELARAPSGGLIENPQDVTFFDFHLIDPKDSPFVTFRFHYRSWQNLLQLSLVPSEGLDSSEPSVNGRITDDNNNSASQENMVPTEKSNSTIPSSFDHIGPDASVFDDSSSSDGLDGLIPDEQRPRRNSSYILRTPPQLRPRSATSHTLPQPSKTVRDGITPGCSDPILQRPLPNRPLPDLPCISPEDTWMAPSRKSSNASAAPSVAPSLVSYVKNESYLNETVEFGQAQEVHIGKEFPRVPVLQEQLVRSPGTRSISDYDADSPRHDQRDLSSTRGEKSPREVMLESPIENAGMHAMSVGDTVASERSQSSLKENVTTRSRDLALDFARFPHLQLSQSDWKPRTPSPQSVPRRMLSPRFGRLWSTLRRNKSRSPLRDAHDELVPKNYSTPQLTGPEVKEKHGNWI